MKNKEVYTAVGDQVMERNQITTNTSEDTIDLIEIFYLLLDRIWQIILCMVLCGALAFSYTFFWVTPQYSATAKMYIVSASNDSVINLSDLQVGSSLRSDYQQLLMSRPLLEQVISNLNLQMDYMELGNSISITNPSDSRILCVTVTNPSPVQAADIANELVNQSKIYLPEIMKTDEPSFYEPAIVPTQKASPSISKNTIIGALVGAVLCCAFHIVKHLMNDTLVTPDDVEKCFGIRPLVAIPEGDFEKGKKGKKGKKSKSDKKIAKSKSGKFKHSKGDAT